MDGNSKYLIFFLLFSFISCENKEKKTQLAYELISNNLNILLDDLDYFAISDSHFPVGVYQYIGEIESDQNIVIKKFQNKFDLKNEKIFNETIKIEKTPKTVGNYQLYLDTDDDFQKINNTIKISFVNLIISKNNRYACIEVVKSLGSAAKFEIYYFKQVNGKWIFEGKELLSLG